MDRRLLIKVAILAGAAGTCMPQTTFAALIPPAFLQCVVSLGFIGPLNTGAGVVNGWQTIGTGFFWGRLESDDPDPKKKTYSTYLITAGHVIDDYNRIKLSANGQFISPLKVRIDPAALGIPLKEMDVSELSSTQFQWMKNPNGKDIAAIPVNLAGLRAANYQSMFYAEDMWVAGKEKLKNLGVSEGDGVFVLGFPMGISGNQKNYVIAKQGVIARISDFLDGNDDIYLIDSLVFPGNSGGPVILRPEIIGIEGTKTNGSAFLIGIVISYLPYTDTAVSQQTGRARISFEENSGLAQILPVDYIHDTVEFVHNFMRLHQ